MMPNRGCKDLERLRKDVEDSRRRDQERQQELSSNHGHSTDVNIKQPNKMPPQKLSSGIAAVQKAPVPHSKEHVVMSQRIKRRMNQIALFHFMRLSRRIATQQTKFYILAWYTNSVMQNDKGSITEVLHSANDMQLKARAQKVRRALLEEATNIRDGDHVTEQIDILETVILAYTVNQAESNTWFFAQPHRAY